MSSPSDDATRPGPVAGAPSSGARPRSAAAALAAYRDAIPPTPVHRAFLTFTGYLGVGLLSGLVGLVFVAFTLASVPGGSAATVGGGVLTLALGLVVGVAVLLVMVQMRAGRAWARAALTALAAVGLVFAVLGVVGTVTSFAATVELYGQARAVLGGAFTVAQTLLLIVGLWLMYRPTVPGYFR